jgi:hypothetical protein
VPRGCTFQIQPSFHGNQSPCGRRLEGFSYAAFWEEKSVWNAKPHQGIPYREAGVEEGLWRLQMTVSFADWCPFISNWPEPGDPDPAFIELIPHLVVNCPRLIHDLGVPELFSRPAALMQGEVSGFEERCL